MSEREAARDENEASEKSRSGRDREDESARPAQRAARNEPGGEEDKHPDDETDSATWDTEEHSDAPGPFGTG